MRSLRDRQQCTQRNGDLGLKLEELNFLKLEPGNVGEIQRSIIMLQTLNREF